MKITEIYLEDFQSRQARIHHARYSPVNDLRLRKRGRGRHTYRHYHQLANEEEGGDDAASRQ